MSTPRFEHDTFNFAFFAFRLKQARYVSSDLYIARKPHQTMKQDSILISVLYLLTSETPFIPLNTKSTHTMSKLHWSNHNYKPQHSTSVCNIRLTNNNNFTALSTATMKKQILLFGFLLQAAFLTLAVNAQSSEPVVTAKPGGCNLTLCGGSCDGSSTCPVATIADGVALLPTGGTISLLAGTYTGQGNANVTLAGSSYRIVYVHTFLLSSLYTCLLIISSTPSCWWQGSSIWHCILWLRWPAWLQRDRWQRLLLWPHHHQLPSPRWRWWRLLLSQLSHQPLQDGRPVQLSQAWRRAVRGERAGHGISDVHGEQQRYWRRCWHLRPEVSGGCGACGSRAEHSRDRCGMWAGRHQRHCPSFRLWHHLMQPMLLPLCLYYTLSLKQSTHLHKKGLIQTKSSSLTLSFMLLSSRGLFFDEMIICRVGKREKFGALKKWQKEEGKSVCGLVYCFSVSCLPGLLKLAKPMLLFSLTFVVVSCHDKFIWCIPWCVWSPCFQICIAVGWACTCRCSSRADHRTGPRSSHHAPSHGTHDRNNK